MLQPVQLYRRWRAAAGLDFAMNVPAAPFSELGAISQLDPAETEQPQSETLAESIAAALCHSEIAQEVLGGRAAFVIDLPGYLSVGVGAYLQTEGIAPVSLLAGFYQQNAFLDGWPVLPNLVYFGNLLGSYSGEKGFAFLLERERLPDPEPDKYAVLEQFDNRYTIGSIFFPEFELMQSKGIQALVDVRPLGQEVTPDLLDYYREAAEADFNIYSSRLDLEKLISVKS